MFSIRYSLGINRKSQRGLLADGLSASLLPPPPLCSLKSEFVIEHPRSAAALTIEP